MSFQDLNSKVTWLLELVPCFASRDLCVHVCVCMCVCVCVCDLVRLRVKKTEREGKRERERTFFSSPYHTSIKT